MSFAFTVREISIHTLRVEGDERDPSWRQQLDISIHTLRVEGDSGVVASGTANVVNFNPHPPRGG